MTSQSCFPTMCSILSQDAVLCEVKKHYAPINATACMLHRRGIQDTYFVRSDKGPYYLKVFYSNYRTISELNAEIAAVKQLTDCGLRAVKPVKTEDGGHIIDFTAAEGVRYGVLYESAPGRQISNNDLTPRQIEEVGVYLAEIYNAWDAQPVLADRPEIDTVTFIAKPMEYFHRLAEMHPGAFDVAYVDDMAAELSVKINRALPRILPEFGLCHGDIYADNIFFDGDTPTLFDFDFCGKGWRSYDISMFLNCIGWGAGDEAEKKRALRREQFLNGYTSKRDISNLELEFVPVFGYFRRIFNIGGLFARFADIWGHAGAIYNINDEIRAMKEWQGRTPVPGAGPV